VRILGLVLACHVCGGEGLWPGFPYVLPRLGWLKGAKGKARKFI
jgi:hypothetical protein